MSKKEEKSDKKIKLKGKFSFSKFPAIEKAIKKGLVLTEKDIKEIKQYAR